MSRLVDTDVLIWHLHGQRQAARRQDSLAALKLAAVSDADLRQGRCNPTTQAALKKMLEQYAAAALPLAPAITPRAIVLMEARARSQGLQTADALMH